MEEHAEVLKAYTRAQHEKGFVMQMKGEEDFKYNRNNEHDFKHITNAAKGVAQGDLSDPTGHGLSDARVLAVRTESLEDYDLVNKANAIPKSKTDKPTDRMEQLKPVFNPIKEGTSEKAKAFAQAVNAVREEQHNKDWEKEKAEKYNEGRAIGGVLNLALADLPITAAKIFRGRRMSPEAFASEYKVGKTFSYDSFASTSTDEGIAREFSRGSSSSYKNPLPQNATVAVIVEAKVYTARDIEGLSMNPHEKERLLKAGTTLTVVSIKEEPGAHDKGVPPYATQWWRVKCLQVAMEKKDFRIDAKK